MQLNKLMSLLFAALLGLGLAGCDRGGGQTGQTGDQGSAERAPMPPAGGDATTPGQQPPPGGSPGGGAGQP
jgi:hypothetical protein